MAPLVYLLQKIFFRMTLFSFFLFVSLTLLYGAGNYQEFLDSSQIMILKSLIFISITLFFFAATSIIFTIMDTLFSRFYSMKKTAAIIFYAVSIILSALAMIAGRAILVLAAGA